MPSTDTRKVTAYRLVNILLFPALVLVALGVIACSVSIGWRGKSHWNVASHHPGATWTFSANDETFLAQTTAADTTEIAVLRDGELSGVDGLSAQQRKQAEGMRGNNKLVDHSKLQEWQAQLDQMATLADDEATTPETLADASVGFPFGGALGTLWMRFLRDDPERACGVLDRVDDIDLRDSTMRSIIDVALKGSSLEDDRLAGWLSSAKIRDDRQSFGKLAGSTHLGTKSSRRVIEHVDDLLGSERRQVFEAAGKKLVANPRDARFLVASLDELYGSERSHVALTLLNQENATAEYACELLRDIDEFYGSQRKDVYLTAGRKAIAHPDAPNLLVQKLDELYGSDRSSAAIRVINWAESPEEVALGYLREIDEFYGSQQERVLEALISSRHFESTPVQRAVLRAAKSELHASRLRRVLDRMETSPHLDNAVLALVKRAKDD